MKRVGHRVPPPRATRTPRAAPTDRNGTGISVRPSPAEGHRGGEAHFARGLALAVLRIPEVSSPLARNPGLPAGAKIARHGEGLLLLVERVAPARAKADAVAAKTLEIALTLARELRRPESLSAGTSEPEAPPPLADLKEMLAGDARVQVRERPDGRLTLSIGDGRTLSLDSIRGGYALRSEDLEIAPAPVDSPIEGDRRIDAASAFLLQLSARPFLRVEAVSREARAAFALASTFDSLTREALVLAIESLRSAFEVFPAIHALLNHAELAKWYLATSSSGVHPAPGD